MHNKLTWSIRSVPLKELKDYEFNPRVINKPEFEKLVRGIKEDGYHQRILVNTDLTIIGGHQRKKALIEAGVKESDKIEVLIPNRTLSQEEFDRINIRDNLPYGKYDFDMLSNRFDMDTLFDFGVPEEWIMSPDLDDTEVCEPLDEIINCKCNCHICNCECHEKKKKKKSKK